MGRLADQLAITRVTLYRWVGSREDLLTETLWSLTQDAFAFAATRLDTDDTAPRSAQLVSGFVRLTLEHQGMRTFLEDEPDLALRLLTTRAASFQARLIELVDRHVLDDMEHGRLHSTVPHDDLAFVVVRVAESFVYTRSLGSRATEPDPERARTAIHAILHDCRGAGTA